MRETYQQIDEMTGDFLPPDGKIYSDPLRGYFSCHGVKATGPRQSAILSASIGTREHAEKELIDWKRHTRKLTFELVQLMPGEFYLESIQWGLLTPMIIPTIHGTQNVGNIKADNIVCKE